MNYILLISNQSKYISLKALGLTVNTRDTRLSHYIIF
ncbi:hypothetical protein [Pseudomonas phage vB_Pa-PAC2]